MSYEYFIGTRFLRAKHQEAFISLITLLSIAGVAVGVMALIVVIAVMAGFESDLKHRILDVESHVVVMRHGGSFYDYGPVMEKIKGTEGVTAATPFIYSQIMLRSSSGVSGAVLRGIDPESAGKVIKILKKNVLDRLEKAHLKKSVGLGKSGIILGKELAGNLGVVPGDTVYLISGRGLISPIGHLPSIKRFKIAGIFESGMYEYDGSLAYIHLKDAQDILHMKDSVTGIEVRVDDIYKAGKVGEKIIAKIGFPYWTRDWMQMNHNLFSALKLEKTVMFIILALIVLVAAFNIASTLIMMVMGKTKDIAILKAMGATEKSIRKIFVFKGMIIGFLGTTFGVFSGFLICKLIEKYKFIKLPGDVYYITTLPVSLQAMDVLIIATAAMVICFLATIYPAQKASRLNPVEAIRYG